MRRHRNPRYAPESLERKLNPSTFGAPVLAEVAPIVSLDVELSQSTAVTVSYDQDTISGNPICFEGPGSPEPATPPPGSSAPPRGSGDPPISGPSLPGGPGEPA